MEIKNSLVNQAGAYRSNMDETQRTAARRSAQPAPEQTAKAQGDRVSVSPEAMLRTEAHKAINSASDVRREKVDSIKASLADGTYTMDSKNIAQKLLESESFLASSLTE